MQIIVAEEAQAELLTRISISAKSHWGYAGSVIKSWLPELTITAESIQLHPTFTAAFGHSVLGFYQLDLRVSRKVLQHLWVLPEHMGKGIGRQLVEHALAQAGESLYISSDPYAEGFYKACGARRIAILPAAIDGSPDRFLPQMELG